MKWKRSKKAQQEAKAKAAAAKKDKNGNSSAGAKSSNASSGSQSQAPPLDDSASDLGEDILMNESDVEDLEEEEEIEVGVEETGHAPSLLAHAHAHAHSLFAPPTSHASPGSLPSHPGLHSPLATPPTSIATPPGLRAAPLNLVNGHGHLNGLMAAAAAANRAAEQARSGDMPQGATPPSPMSSLLPTAAHLAKLGPNNRLYRPFVA